MIFSNFNRCTSCSNKHTDCFAKTVVNYAEVDEGRGKKKTATSKPKVIDLGNDGSKTNLSPPNLQEDTSATTSKVTTEATSSKQAEIVDLISEGNESNSRTSYDDIAKASGDQQEHIQKETSTTTHVIQANGSSGDRDNSNDHDHTTNLCCSSSAEDPIQEADENVSLDFCYTFSEECDILLKIMPDKFVKGYKVLHNPKSNQTWIAGQVYRLKDGTSPWVFVQCLELRDATRKGINQFNIALASYQRVVDFLQRQPKEGNTSVFSLLKF